MTQKAVRVVVDLHLRAVTCPGVFLTHKDDLYLSVCLMNHYKKSKCHSPVFPIMFQEKMTFDKVFKHVYDPAEVAELLECERVKIELIQLVPPVGKLLAHFQEDVRSFLFPEPRLVPPSSGVDREELMTRCLNFPGIAPRLEFSTRTSIRECPGTAENNFYPNVLLRLIPGKPKRKKSTLLRGRLSTKPGSLAVRTAPPSGCGGPRSRSLSPSTSKVLGRHQSDTETWSYLDVPAVPCSDRPWLKDCHASGQRPVDGLASMSPRHQSACVLARQRSPGMDNPSLTDQGSGKQSHPTGWLQDSDSVGSDTSSSRVTDKHVCRNVSSCQQEQRFLPEVEGDPRWAVRQSLGPTQSTNCPLDTWDEVHQRVRGLLTTSRAMHRLACGATESEIDEVLARRSISPCRI